MKKKLKQYFKWYIIGILFITLFVLIINSYGHMPYELVYGIYFSFTALMGSLFKYDDTDYGDTNINSNNEIKCM